MLYSFVYRGDNTEPRTYLLHLIDTNQIDIGESFQKRCDCR